PALRLICTFTVVDGSRLLVQAMVCAVPMTQLAPATGDVTANAGLPIVNTPLVPAAATAPFADTRTSADVVAGAVTIHANVPLAAADADSVVQLPPPLRLSSTRTVVPPGRLLLVHAMVRAVPIAQFAPAPGDVTTTDRVTIANAPPTPLADTAPLPVIRIRASAASGP